jgi:methylmalonyl-CoA mutase N-terminal domain/subunit
MATVSRQTKKTPAREAGKLFSKRATDKISAMQDEWEAGILKESLKQTPEKRSKFRSGSGDIVVNRIYTPLDIADFDYERDLGLPGQYPFTRGIYTSGARRLEYMLGGFYSGFGTREDANKRMKDFLEKGATHVSAGAWDLPTQLGYDSDHPMAKGEVGKVGVAIDSLEDMEYLYDGIPQDKMTPSTVGNCIGPVAVSFFYAFWEKKGVPPQQMRLHCQNDPFKEYTGRGTCIFSPQMALSLATDVTEFSNKYIPQTLSRWICTSQMRWGGCSAAQEIAFGMSNMVTYIDAAIERGIKVEEIVPRANFHATVDNDLFEEVAKFRAIRRLWARVASERYKTKDPRVLAMAISNWTGSHRMTAQQPLNNIVRTTLHTLACMLGGVEGINNPAYDEALALPTVESQRLARVTQHIVHYEGGLANTVDPLAGSYYVESLTNQIEEQAYQIYKQVQAIGGGLAAVETGYYLRAMADGMAKYQREVESGERFVIGINRDVLAEELPIKIFSGNPEAEKKQLENLRSLKERRNSTLVKEALEKVRQAAEKKLAKNDLNIVPSVLDAVRVYCTIGEICGVLRDIFGEYQPLTYF